MPPALSNLARRFTVTVGRFTVAQRTIALIGIAVLVLGGIALTSWLARPTYSPLFSGMKDADASAVVEQLRKDGVAYQLADGGSTVLVPEDKVYDERLKAAAAGLPAAPATGYSLLDKMGVTSSEFQQKVTYKRAIEGELAATIGHLDGVETASVQLAIPDKTVFTAQAADPTASVFIKTRPGQEVSTEQVQAIVHLTSASVEKLTPKNVSVVDSTGTVLSAVGTGTTGTTGAQASDYQKQTQASVQAVLDRVVGPGNATVAVTPEIETQSADRTTESFTTTKGTEPLSETTTTEAYKGTGSGGSTGVLGPDNIAVPGASASGGASAAANGNGNYTSSSTTRNNAVDKVTEQRSVPAGSLKRQSVSVAVNQTAAGGVNVASLNQLVSAAAGIDAQRGDTLSLQVVPFSTSAAQQADAALKAAQAEADARANQQMWTNIFLGIGGLFLLLIIVGILWLRSRRTARQPLELGGSPLTLQEMVDGPVAVEGPAVEAIGAAPMTSAIPLAAPLEAIGPIDSDVELRRSQVDALGAADPKIAADYLRGMMDDRARV
ncbi:flagellar basal-body MS-ring/collar protein FliF [Tersicoccus sp. Bi-70]|uniref:flagellar basal-body MS-ring/collar protein FliF n=1 Tax=Tersicoccus sp. Bi-70 TaxID=1897634 RepID=UPI0009769BE0|nr:flagellar basal-body MS-ring/collar protein FliF [Tersicoccus sp. Bi-70]OMH30574.1 flagellar M-ring protein FliF [Tersicoccus sp. Bi-70]